MSKKVLKLFLACDYEKEQAWLNEMSGNGYQLTNVSAFFYTFEENPADDYVYILEFTDKIPLFCDTPNISGGSVFIGHVGRWVYTKKKVSDVDLSGADNINYQIDMMKQVRLLYLSLALCLVMIVFNSARAFIENKSVSTFIILALTLSVDLVGWYGIIKLSSRIKNLRNNYTK